MVEIERRISYGTIVQVVIVVGGLFAALFTNWLNNDHRLLSVEMEVAELKQAQTSTSSRVDNLDTNMAAAISRLQNTLTDLRVGAKK